MSESDIGSLIPGRSKSFLDQMDTVFSASRLDTRGENAHAVAVKFFQMLQEQVEDEEECRKLMNAWLKSVRENDFRKFRRALNRYAKSLEEPNSPDNDS